jgi:hypothetical protein
MTRLLVAAALAVPLLGAPAHAAYCEGRLSDTAVTACSRVYGTWCTAWDRPCETLRLP